jgi:hypothetical protein
MKSLSEPFGSNSNDPKVTAIMTQSTALARYWGEVLLITEIIGVCHAHAFTGRHAPLPKE